MQTFNRICLKDHTIEDRVGNKFELQRGKEYLTSKEEKGAVTVFSRFWVSVPSNLFGGEVEFTK